MKRIVIAMLLGMFAHAAQAANVNIDGLPAATSVAGTDLNECEQGGINRKCTPAQMAAYVYGLTSADATISGTGAVTLATVNSNVGSFGSATNCVSFTTNGKGLITAASATTCTPGIASVTGLGTGVATALAINIGTAGSPVVNGGALGTPSSGVGTNLTSLNASNLASGTVAAARGGAGTITGALKGSGAGVVTQAACSDLSNGATGCSTAIGTSGATIGLLNAANSWSAIQTFAAGDLVLTGGSGCATFTAGVLSSTGSACGSGSTTITAGTTPTSGFTSGNLIATAGAVATDSGIATSAVATLTGAQTLTNKTLTSPIMTAPALGTIASGVATNLTGTAAGLTAGNVTTNANLTGDVTSVGNATTLTNAPVIAKVLTGFTSGAGTVTSSDSILSALQKVNGNDALKAPLASPALTGTPTAPTATVGTNTTQLATTAFVLANASGSVTSVAAGCGNTTGGSPITTTGTISAAITRRANTATTDTIVSTDCGNVVSESNASPVAATIAQAGTTGFAAGSYFWICNINAGAVTITPTTSTIGGASTLVINAGSAAHPNCTGFQSDGTNYNLIDAVPGSGVALAAANALSSAGGLTSTIASGTATIPATAIASGACGTAITVTATNVATTDVVMAGFAADPTATTGFLPTAMLTIVPYPTSGNANFKVCNLTSGSITPTSTTINWRVTR